MLWLAKRRTSTGSSNFLLPKFLGRSLLATATSKSQVPQMRQRLTKGLAATSKMSPWLCNKTASSSNGDKRYQS